MQRLTEPYLPEDCFIVFENLGRAHFVKRVLNDMGYSLEAAHTGHGAMRQIASANLETDPIDAYKLALVAKDLWMGRGYIRTAHPSSDENMRTEALCRIVAECAEIRDETNLRIKETIKTTDNGLLYLDLAGIDVGAPTVVGGRICKTKRAAL